MGEQPPKRILSPGIKAPDFRLKTTPDQMVGLQDFEGQPVVLVFYPADWSPVCGDELDIFNEALPEIRGYGANLAAISVDNVWSHIAYARDRKLRFPLCSDFEPKGRVAKYYGAYEEGDGICSRALFLVDGDGVIRWSYLSPMGVNPGVEGVLDALERLQLQEKKGAA